MSNIITFKCFLLEDTYEKKWKGLCFNGQKIKRKSGKSSERLELNHKKCKDKCSSDVKCVAFASHPKNYCYLTFADQIVSQWTAKSHAKYTCYKKVPGTSYFNVFITL